MLEQLIHPLPVQASLDEYWEKKILHLSRSGLLRAVTS
jgi:hypothetical protein